MAKKQKQKRKPDAGLAEWALLGARHRLQELVDETASIFGHFPSLRTWAAQHPYPWNKQESRARAEPARGRRRKRRTMTAAQKKAVSARMKKYWAARRKAETK